MRPIIVTDQISHMTWQFTPSFPHRHHATRPTFLHWFTKWILDYRLHTHMVCARLLRSFPSTQRHSLVTRLLYVPPWRLRRILPSIPRSHQVTPNAVHVLSTLLSTHPGRRIGEDSPLGPRQVSAVPEDLVIRTCHLSPSKYGVRFEPLSTLSWAPAFAAFISRLYCEVPP